MIRPVLALAAVASVAIGIDEALRVTPVDALLGPADCRHTHVMDARSGLPVTGIEDLALSVDGATLIASAHDRQDGAAPDGAVYRIAVAALDGAEPPIATPTPLPAPSTERTGFRPHGVARAEGGDALAVINRHAPGEARIDVFGSGGAYDRTLSDPMLCRANDLVWSGSDALLITLDRAACGTDIADLVPWARTGRVVRWTGARFETVRDGLVFPNGIALKYVAETRADRITPLAPAGEPIAVPGGPDNLSADGSGHLLAAVHPNLLRLALGWTGLTIPSRIVRVALADGDVEVLYDDPDGVLLSGATVAIRAGPHIVAGAARDAGLLVCSTKT